MEPRKRKSSPEGDQRDGKKKVRELTNHDDTEQSKLHGKQETGIEHGPSFETDPGCSSPSFEERKVHLDGKSAMDEVFFGDDSDGHVQVQRIDLDKMKERHFARAGILESVQLDRFMSHKCFKYELGPNVNIIHGGNGSGKSAIVAALQIGLGANAKVTERGVQMKDHIMHGNNSAVITIRIHNRKPNHPATEPDMTFRYEKEVDGKDPELIYGPKIIIERRILRSGVSYWTVKNWLGYPVDTEGRPARTEVRNIIDHFGFMVDNPVAFLTQAKSRAFLGTLRPSRLYALYKEATLLAAIESELLAIVTRAENVKLALNGKRKVFNHLETKMQDIQTELMGTREMKTIDEEIADTNTLYAWTGVEEIQNSLQDREQRLAKEFEPAAKRAQIACEKAAEEIRRLSSSVSDIQAKVKSSADRWKQAYEVVRDSKTEELSCKHHLEHHQRLAIEYECEIQEGKQGISQTKDSLKSARRELLTGKEKKGEFLQRLEKVTHLISSLEKAVSEAQRREASAHENVYSTVDNARKAQGHLHTLQMDFDQKRRELSEQQRTEYHRPRTVVQLLGRIYSRQADFQEAPIGPLSEYVEVLDEHWVGTVEFCVGTYTLQSFIVHNARDASLLQKLLPDNPRPNIYVSNLRRARYRISEKHMPQVDRSRYRTMLDILKIRNDAVFNVLVDERSVDRIVLVGAGEDVTELGWSRLPNIVEACNAAGQRAYIRNRSNVFRKSTDHNTMGRGMLTTNRMQYLRSLEVELGKLHEKLQHQAALVIQAENLANSAQAQIAPVKHNVRTRQKELNEARQKKAEIEYQLNRIIAVFDPKPYEDEIVRLETGVMEAEKRLKEKLIYISDLKKKLEDLNETCQQAVNDAREKKEQEVKLTDKLENLNGVLAKEKSNLRDKEVMKEKATHVLQMAQAEIHRYKAESAKQTALAMKLGERPTSTDAKKNSTTKLSAVLSRLKERLKQEEGKRGGRSVKEIEMDYLRTKTIHTGVEPALRRIEYYQKALESGGRARIKQCRKLERGLRISVRSNFLAFLATRGHDGKIIIRKDKQGEYELLVTLKMTSHNKEYGEVYETKDLRSLSGGERSFVTLAFLLALAEATQNPIRVMDEIDVFQDPSNRAASFQTLVEYCSSYLPEKQFIIITPSAISGIRPSESVRIVRLDPPRR